MRDYRSDTIYFVVLDRFFDGDPDNNTGKDDDFDPSRTDWWKYWGGDLAGLIDKLDYVRSLGASSVWITPVFDQVDGVVPIGGARMAPYHGYWAKDFKRLDEHLVDDPAEVRVFTRNDTVFDRLVRELHARDMRLVLDIVCNHSNPNAAGGRGELYDDGALIASYDDDRGDWYRREGGVVDWNDLNQVQTRDLAGLADFDEETFAYRTYIKDAMRGWLDKGVDALRCDTVKHMPLWFWQEFTGDMAAHKPDLFAFGEWFQGGCWDPAAVEFANKSGMTILDFAWRNAVVGALAQGSARGLRDVVDVVERDSLFHDATSLVTFVDNHDLPRFLTLADDPERFRVAVLLTLVARGIPCLYYGGEQLLHCDTGGGNDPYNRPMMTSFERTPLCADIARLAALRKRSPAIQKAGMRTKWVDEDRWVFSRPYLGSTAVVGVNRSNDAAELSVEALELGDGRYEDELGGAALEVTGGRAKVRVPARGIVVYGHVAQSPRGTTTLDAIVHGISTQPGEDVYLCGDAPELGGWDVDRAVRLEYVDRATWAGTVALDASAGRSVLYKYLVRRPNRRVLREPGRAHRRHVVPAGYDCWRDVWRE